MKKKALVTGVTGQDGAYLSELLLAKGYEVHGIKRRSSLINTARIDHLYQDPHESNQHFQLHYGDLTDAMNITRIIQEVKPDEIYNLGAMSHVIEELLPVAGIGHQGMVVRVELHGVELVGRVLGHVGEMHAGIG